MGGGEGELGSGKFVYTFKSGTRIQACCCTACTRRERKREIGGERQRKRETDRERKERKRDEEIERQVR